MRGTFLRLRHAAQLATIRGSSGLGEVPNGPAVDLKIETQIPSKVRGPQNE